MPRQSRGSARPAPARHAPAPQQSRQASTASVPATHQVPHPPAAAQSSGPGMFGNMMSTAAGVGIGSAIGHSVGSFFTGGSSAAPAAEQPQQPAPYQSNAYNDQQYSNQGMSCEGDAKAFTKCLEQTNNDMSACSFYLDQLKQCQAMMRG